MVLEYADVRTAEAVADAVSPDNFKTPAGLFVKTFRRGCSVVSEVKAEGKFGTFVATVDDLLFCVSTAEKAVRAAKVE